MSKSILRCLSVLGFVALVSLSISSCRKAPKPTVTVAEDPNGPKGTKVDTSVGPVTVAAFRYEPARGSDSWTRFRDFLPKLNSYLGKEKPDAVPKLSDADRKYLTGNVHLTSSEMSDLEAPEFRTADAHYLDECYLMRDAVRAVDPGTIDSTEQQSLALFRWMNRNVFLHEQVDTWVPPAFTLRRGHGGAVDRAMAFLALLRQEKIDGCLLVVPDSDPLQFVVGVLEPKSSELYLFDTRLGLPIAGKKAGSIATLKEAQADPKLLVPAHITPEQANKLEAWLVCPLQALSTRMLWLQDNVAGLERVVLYQNPREVDEAIAKATKLPVKVWNPPTEETKNVNSPTRCLDNFLPKQEGGQDTKSRAMLVNHARTPSINVAVNFGQINITPNVLGSVYGRLDGVVGDLFVKYELQPREMFLRGHYDAMRQRLGRVQPLLTTVANDKGFPQELANWFKLMNAANGNALEHKDPAVKAKAQQVIDSLGGTDFILAWTRDIDNEKTLADFEKDLNVKGDAQRATSTKIIALAIRDQLDPEVQRMQAAASHEKAERAEAIMQGNSKPSESIARRAEEGWITAKSAWKNFYLAPIDLDETIKRRLDQMRNGITPIVRTQGEEAALRTSLLESLHLDVQRVLNAKLRLAECIAHKDSAKAAKEYLEKTKQEIEQLEKKGALREEISNLQTLIQRFPPAARDHLQRRLDLLSRDWSEKGSLYWMKQQIDQRIK